MIREIGSEFWDVPIQTNVNNYFPKCTQWFLSGRIALKSIINELHWCHTVAMPSWCCDSMVKPFIEAGFSISFYPVYWHEKLRQDILLNCDVLFLLDYFGYSSYKLDLRGYSGVIIRDLTHSIFSTTYEDADFYFGSLRKWCGLSTGGFAWTNDGHKMIESSATNEEYVFLRKRAMNLKREYISDCSQAYRFSEKEQFLKLFERAEEVLSNCGVARADESDIKMVQYLDVDYIRDRRRKNAEILLDILPEWFMFKDIEATDCPMFVPILVPNQKRDSLRRYLIDNGVYCPVHWPRSEYHNVDMIDPFIYDNELSLICDQRYKEDDMKYISSLIYQFLEES